MSQFQSLFVKCQECMQRPATIKCFQHNTVTRLCYSCDQAASRVTTHSRKTEIIPYQGNSNYHSIEMYVKTVSQINPKKDLITSDSQKQFLSTGKNSRVDDDSHQQMYQTQKNYRDNECTPNQSYLQYCNPLEHNPRKQNRIIIH